MVFGLFDTQYILPPSQPSPLKWEGVKHDNSLPI